MFQYRFPIPKVFFNVSSKTFESYLNICSCYFLFTSTGRRIPIALPNTGALSRRRHTLYIRSAIIIFILFAFLQFHVINYGNVPYSRSYGKHLLNCFILFPPLIPDSSDSGPADTTNYSTAAILHMVPPVFHKYLTSKTRNATHGESIC